MAAINVLNKILKWSLNRPPWQRDALRCLVTEGELDESDIRRLSQLCKSQHGLGDGAKPVPLDVNHLPQPDAWKKPVSLQSLTHHAGVNALATDQTVEFGPQLTIVYGVNAAGKSGYIRILKRACRARGAEEILGNVMSGATPARPSATIKFTADEESCEHLWNDDQPPNANAFLSRVSIFDHHCASVYVAKQTDVAFRPMGLDLFDKLSDGCEAVRKTLKKEQSALKSQELQFPDVTEGTAVHKLITNLTLSTESTDPESVKELASLTEADKERSKEVRERIRGLQSDDPEKTAQAIELRAKHAEVLVARVKTADEALSDTSIAGLFAARDRKNETRCAAEESHRATFKEQPLPNTGSDVWRTLWDAAERFSTADAYPGHAFPFTEEDSRCVLCQQELTDEGGRRLRQFQEFLSSAVQSEHDRTKAEYSEKHSQLNETLVLDKLAEEALDELQIDNPDLAEAVRACLDATETRREKVNKALTEDLPCPQNLPAWSLNVHILTSYIENLGNRAKELREANQREVIDRLKRELNELEARQLLADHLPNVLKEIERKEKIAAYERCVGETQTNMITRESSKVTKSAVTEQLTKSFLKELNELEFDHIEVQMVDAGGVRGALYHKLQFGQVSEKTEVSKVVSEGEARCLSIASFFAELSTAADQSAIIFDDPVSSLDHNWRGKVAERLVVESKSRQVIVFTHDIVFLHMLEEKAEDDVKHQYLRRDQTAVGLSFQQLPWAAMKAKKRIGHLNVLWQAADTTYRNGDQQKYEQDASHIYGLLRETWEQGVEEVLLNGIVERFRESIQTQRVSQLVDICPDDCEALDAGMKKCSKFLTGHDQSPAENAPFPKPEELRKDINELDEWIKKILSRRKK